MKSEIYRTIEKFGNMSRNTNNFIFSTTRKGVFSRAFDIMRLRVGKVSLSRVGSFKVGK